MKIVLAILLLSSPTPAQEGGPEKRARLRDLGIAIGDGMPGRHNAITDVPGVKVGHVTLVRGDGKLVPGQGPVRTGVTAVLPHSGDFWNQKVPAAIYALNGNGEMTGSHWIATQGALEVPIMLTNTMSVPDVAKGVNQYMIKKYPAIGITDDVVIPTVAECDDSTLNDARGMHVTPADAVRAIETAKSGPVEEGAVGAGTGMISFEFKSGIGTASRVLSKEDGGWTVGVLVNANMALRRQLTVNGVKVGKQISDLMPIEATDGSIIVVIATDAPLDHLKLKRVAEHAPAGIFRTGATARHGSGDIIIAFSTGNRVPSDAGEKTKVHTLKVVGDDYINPVFDAVQEAVEEAILNSLTAAVTTVGRDGNTAYALPLDRLKALAQPRP